MNINITITHNKSRVGKFGVVNLDYDQVWVMDDGKIITKKSRPSRNGSALNILGLPATARFLVSGGDEYVSLHEDLQKWMHSLSRNRVPSMSDVQAKLEWKSLMWDGRMITDFAGSASHADYINGTHLDAGPMKLKPMVTGGSILKIKGETRVGGSDCYIVDAINPISGYRQYNPVDHWWLFFYPTISRRDGVITRTSARIENLSHPFDQYDANTVLPVFAMSGKNENYIQKDRVRVLSDTEDLPNPYVPARINPYQI